MKKNNWLFKVILTLGVIILLCFIYFLYVFFAPNISAKNEKEGYLYIYPEYTFNDVVHSLNEHTNIKNTSTFKQVAKFLKYNQNIRTGRYKIPSNISNYKLIKRLRNKEQEPVKVTFNNIRTKEQLAGRLSEQLMPDSLSILNLLNDELYLSNYNLNKNTALTLFIPNTYEMFWDITPEKIFQRMSKEYDRFWTKERKAKAEAIPLSPVEVSILASIVEEETNKVSERPIVAGLYINRLRKGMPLQADPTVKFAVGDFSLQRVLTVHLQTDSPYNTYKYKGLPPGPIRCPSPNSIDAVLNYKTHHYLYMCAKETLNGEHNFSTTLSEHLQNARKYQNALNSRRIYR